MAKGFKFEANFSGYDKLRKSPEIIKECRNIAERIADACGEGFEVKEIELQRKTTVVVHPSTKKAFFRNLNGNVLEKAWRSVRAN